MIKLVDINESNYFEAIKLSVTEEQQKFLDRPTGIVARGYVYRKENARVFGICEDEKLVGLALVKDMDEEPACYDLQQFMIDHRFQNRGIGTESLRQILEILKEEGKYTCVEVCVNKVDTAALRVYEKVGFVDTGYIDDDLPDYFNWMYYFK